jgi:hypothetical protein
VVGPRSVIADGPPGARAGLCHMARAWDDPAVSGRPRPGSPSNASPYAVLAGNPEGGLWWMRPVISATLAIGALVVAGQMHGVARLLLLIAAAVVVLPGFFQGLILCLASAVLLRAGGPRVQADLRQAARRVVISAPLVVALFVVAALVTN